MRTRPEWVASALVVAVGLCLGAPASFAVEPGELPRDDSGWTVFTPSQTTRIHYVSAASGGDAIAAAYAPGDAAVGADPLNPAGPIKAYRTIGAAMGAARAGEPDWVLLKRGEAWGERIDLKPGRSASERFLIGAYGEGKARPQLRVGAGSAMWFTENGNDCAVVGLDLYAHTRDPASPDYQPSRGAGGLVKVLLRRGETLESLLVEDCALRWGTINICLEAPRGEMRDVVIRRCVITDAYGRFKSQGVYGGHASFTLEQCVFDHNGWLHQGVDPLGKGGDAHANMYNHNTYLSNCRDVVFRGNTFLRPSSIQNKFTANDGRHSARNITIDDNLYVDGELGISLGGNRAGPLRFENVKVTRNVLTDLGRSRPTGRRLAWYLGVQDWDGGRVEGNLFMHQPSQAIVSTIGLALRGRPGRAHTRNVTIAGNVFHGLRTGMAAVIVTDGLRFDDVTFRGNLLQCPTTPTRLVHVAPDVAGITWAGNRYFSAAPADRWFTRGLADFDHIEWINDSAYGLGEGDDGPAEPMPAEQWRTWSGEGPEAIGRAKFAHPERTIETYMASLGLEPSIDAFIRESRKQSKTNWRPELTAAAVNAYLRAGFGMPGEATD